MNQKDLRDRKTKIRELLQKNLLDDARKECEKLCHDFPNDVESWYLLGSLRGLAGAYLDAAVYFQKSIELDPQHADAYVGLGRALFESHKYGEAKAVLMRALDIRPRDSSIYFTLGMVLHKQKKYDQAVDMYLQAVNLNPSNHLAYYHLGIIYQERHDLTDAEKCYRNSLRSTPILEAMNNLGNVLKLQGLSQIDEAIEVYQRAIALWPTSTIVQHNLCYTLTYKNKIDAKSLYLAHLKSAKVYDRCFVNTCFYNTPNPMKQIKVGYVSADFRTHPVAFFIWILLKYHDRSQVEVTCYSNVKEEDAMTQLLRRLSDHWVSIVGLSDDEAAERIRNDDIDILVDLSGYTQYTRLGVFARRAAPVQVTYLGYPNTTGLKEMDYRLTDGWADPEELEPERYYTEELVRLKGGFLSYTAPEGCPEVGILPALEKGYVTFGSFNNLAKVNEEVVRVWSAILKEVSGSRLIMKYRGLSDEGVRERYWRLFEAQGVDRDRVELLGYIVSPEDHLVAYKRVDIGLDPFPYNGTTTTCEALWMGVPVVVLAGDRHAGRVGVSLLSQAGLKEWITTSEEDYIQRAVELAGDLESLARLRSGLREGVRTSSLCDGKLLASQVEQAYRKMWQRWCAQQR